MHFGKTQSNNENYAAQTRSLFVIPHQFPTIFPTPSTTYSPPSLNSRKTHATLVP